MEQCKCSKEMGKKIKRGFTESELNKRKLLGFGDAALAVFGTIAVGTMGTRTVITSRGIHAYAFARVVIRSPLALVNIFTALI